MSVVSITFKSGYTTTYEPDFIKQLKTLDNALILYDDNKIELLDIDITPDDMNDIYDIYKRFGSICKTYDLYDFYPHTDEINKFVSEYLILSTEKINYEKIFKLLKYVNYLDYDLARDLLCYIISFNNFSISVESMIQLFQIV